MDFSARSLHAEGSGYFLSEALSIRGENTPLPALVSCMVAAGPSRALASSRAGLGCLQGVNGQSEGLIQCRFTAATALVSLNFCGA